MESLQDQLEKQPRFQHVLGSQLEAHAFASLVVASLPFPPLPVVVLQGEAGAYGLASSYDLLQQAIAVQQTGCAPAGDLPECKRQILERLRLDMTAHYEQGVLCQGGSSICSFEWVAGAYDIYCSAFRNYLLKNYAVCTQDLRFHALDTVSADSLLLRQGTSQWKAGRELSGEQSCDASSSAAFTSYVQMLRSYAVDLATLPAV